MLKLNKLFSFLIASSILSLGEVHGNGENLNDARGPRHVSARQSRPAAQQTVSKRRPETVVRTQQSPQQRRPISSARTRPIAATPQQRQRVLSVPLRERLQIVTRNVRIPVARPAPRITGIAKRPLPSVSQSPVNGRVRSAPVRQTQVARLQTTERPSQARSSAVIPTRGRAPVRASVEQRSLSAPSAVRHAQPPVAVTPVRASAPVRASVEQRPLSAPSAVRHAQPAAAVTPVRASAPVKASVEQRPLSAPSAVRHAQPPATLTPATAQRAAVRPAQPVATPPAAPARSSRPAAPQHGVAPAAQGVLSFNELPPALQTFAREYARRNRKTVPRTYTEEEAITAINLLNMEGHSHLAHVFANHMNSRGIKTYNLRYRDAPPELKAVLTQQARLEGEELPDDSDEIILSPNAVKKFLTQILILQPRLEAPVRTWLQTTYNIVVD
jgi:hypothetical protein